MGTLPSNTSLDEVLVRIKKSYANPNVGSITQVVLKEGPRAFRIATLTELVDPSSKEFHHYSMKIDQIDRTKHGWFSKPEKSIRLEGKDPDELEKLHTFLEACLRGKLRSQSGDLHLIRGEDYSKLEQLLTVLPRLANADKLQLATNVLMQLDQVTSTIPEFVRAFEGSSAQTLRHIAAASRFVNYKNELNELKKLVLTTGTGENDFQQHLKRNPWMFGSEYSELLSRRTWTRDDRLDYMLRRTADDFLEIVEIKTAFKDPLFVCDHSRDVYYPSARLSPVLGQVIRYIDEVERNRDSILVKDEVDCLKIRARVIVGRDGAAAHQVALRNLNAHLHRIEVITFDQLVRIAERVLRVFEVDEAGGQGSRAVDEPHDDDIPF